METTAKFYDGTFEITFEIEVRLNSTDVPVGAYILELLSLKAKELGGEIADSDFNSGKIWSFNEPKIQSTNNYVQ